MVYVNPNAQWQNTVGAITPESLQGPMKPAELPPLPSANNGLADNVAVPNPVPSTGDVVNGAAAPTSAENDQTATLTQLAELMKGSKSLDALKAEKSNNPELTAATSTLNDLGAQIEGLNNQALALQNEAQYTIPNKAQEDATGRGITAAGLAPITASQLRQNQIKQGAIATQALTVKSAYYAAQGKYNMAKDAADRAATLAFDEQERQINYRKAVLDALAPQLGRDQQARAAKLQADLADRETAIKNGREDAKVGQALIASTLKFYQNDPRAQFAAQEAMKVPLNDPAYISKVMNLVGKYQQNPQETEAAVLDMQYKRAQIAKINADTKLTDAQRQKVLSEATSTGEDTKKQLQNNEALTLAKELRLDSTVGKSSAVGASLAKLVPFGQALGLQGNRSAFEAKVNTLKANLTLDNLKLLKGAMSDKDLLFLNSIGSSLDTNMTEQQFNTELDRIITKLESAGATADGGTTKVWQGVTYKQINGQWVAQ